METKKNEFASSAIVKDDANPNPMTCAPCAPSGGVSETASRAKGAAIGGAIGHALGVGADVVVGAVAGGIAAGKNAAGKIRELINPTAEHEFWRKEFANRPYFTPGTPYEQYGPAFQYGWESYANHNQKVKTFQDVESQLCRDWESRRGQSKLSWTHAKRAAQDAWQRVEKAACGDSCSPA